MFGNVSTNLIYQLPTKKTIQHKIQQSSTTYMYTHDHNLHCHGSINKPVPFQHHQRIWIETTAKVNSIQKLCSQLVKLIVLPTFCRCPNNFHCISYVSYIYDNCKLLDRTEVVIAHFILNH